MNTLYYAFSIIILAKEVATLMAWTKIDYLLWALNKNIMYVCNRILDLPPQELMKSRFPFNRKPP